MKEPMGIEKYIVICSLRIIEMFFDIIVEIELCSTDYLSFNHHKSIGVENRFALRD